MSSMTSKLPMTFHAYVYCKEVVIGDEVASNVRLQDVISYQQRRRLVHPWDLTLGGR